MTDIIARLRMPRTEQGGLWPHPNLHDEAADEIERLRAENEKLLRRIHLFKNTRNEQVFEKLMKANEEIERLRFENETLNKIAVRETVKVATLRAALKPFAECSPIERDDAWFAHEIRIEDFRAAAAALKETDNG